MENILITTAKCCLKIKASRKAGKTHNRIKSLSNKEWFDKNVVVLKGMNYEN